MFDHYYLCGATVAVLARVQYGVPAARADGDGVGAGGTGQAVGLSSLQELGELHLAAAAEELGEGQGSFSVRITHICTHANASTHTHAHTQIHMHARTNTHT